MKARILLISTAWFTTAIVTPAQTLAVGQVTFHKDILPVLQKNCQGCHRPGQIAPMSFLAYEGTRPWAKAIKAAVLSKKMPPWNADPAVGHFTNDRSLKPAEVELITKWVDAGAPAGDSKDAPSPGMANRRSYASGSSWRSTCACC